MLAQLLSKLLVLVEDCKFLWALWATLGHSGPRWATCCSFGTNQMNSKLKMKIWRCPKVVVPQNHGFQYYGLWMIWKCRHLGNLRITSPPCPFSRVKKRRSVAPAERGRFVGRGCFFRSSCGSGNGGRCPTATATPTARVHRVMVLGFWPHLTSSTHENHDLNR